MLSNSSVLLNARLDIYVAGSHGMITSGALLLRAGPGSLVCFSRTWFNMHTCAARLISWQEVCYRVCTMASLTKKIIGVHSYNLVQWRRITPWYEDREADRVRRMRVEGNEGASFKSELY